MLPAEVGQGSKDSVNIWKKKVYNLFVQYFTMEFYSLKKEHGTEDKKDGVSHK